MGVLPLRAHLKGSGDVSARLGKTVRLLGTLSGSSSQHIKNPISSLTVKDIQVHKGAKG